VNKVFVSDIAWGCCSGKEWGGCMHVSSSLLSG
jgi:hypothetical protein